MTVLAKNSINCKNLWDEISSSPEKRLVSTKLLRDYEGIPSIFDLHITDTLQRASDTKDNLVWPRGRSHKYPRGDPYYNGIRTGHPCQELRLLLHIR